MYRFLLRSLLAFVALAGFTSGAFGFYTTEAKSLAEKFAKQVFQSPPPIQYLWVTPPYKEIVKQTLGHPYPKVRIPYWHKDNRYLWVLEEIGKDLPITTAIVVKVVNGQPQVESIRILKFRESRGWQVKLPSFTQQFKQAKLNQDQITPNIDSISGATLSVNAVKKLAKLALKLTKQLQNPNSDEKTP
jgi:hypothetical protein